jgi:hypothetical protein
MEHELFPTSDRLSRFAIPLKYAQGVSWRQVLENFQIPYQERSTGVLYGLCQFHAEKTPSTAYRPSKIRRCYGCSDEGNINDFVLRFTNEHGKHPIRDLEDLTLFYNMLRDRHNPYLQRLPNF